MVKESKIDIVKKSKIDISWNPISDKDKFLLMTFATVCIIVFSVFFMTIGFHNIDMGQNARYLNAEFDLNVVDEMSNGEFYSDTQMYRLGLKQLMTGILVFGASCLFFGMEFVLMDLRR